MMNRNCKGYCGVACVDGTCPQANREEYAERGYDLVNNCNECHYNNGYEIINPNFICNQYGDYELWRDNND